MRTYLKLAAAAAVLAVGTAGPALAQKAKAPAVARIGAKPNFNGIWHVMNSANWNLEPHDAAEAPAAPEKLGAIGAIPAGMGVVEGGKIPYKAESTAKRDENRAGAPMVDPEAACYLPGIPRATYMDHPFQVIQADSGDMLFVYEYASANRTIYMRPTEVPPIDTWMGTSYGQWEGDTLKITTLAQSPGDVIMPGGELKPGVTWLDRSGNYLTNTATVVERFTLKDNDHIAYEATIDDPEVYTAPWKISMILYRDVDPKAELLDFRCVPFADELLYGDLKQK